MISAACVESAGKVLFRPSPLLAQPPARKGDRDHHHEEDREAQRENLWLGRTDADPAREDEHRHGGGRGARERQCRRGAERAGKEQHGANLVKEEPDVAGRDRAPGRERRTADARQNCPAQAQDDGLREQQADGGDDGGGGQARDLFEAAFELDARGDRGEEGERRGEAEGRGPAVPAARVVRVILQCPCLVARFRSRMLAQRAEPLLPGRAGNGRQVLRCLAASSIASIFATNSSREDIRRTTFCWRGSRDSS